MKITAALHAKYDPKTNILAAQLRDDKGDVVSIDFDGVAFASLMGLANLTNAIAHHVQSGKELPPIWVDGLNTGTQSFEHPKTGTTFGMALVLLVPGLGILNFFLPPEVEKSLREKLKPPAP